MSQISAEKERTPQAQAKSSGQGAGQHMAPPPFSLAASPVQRKEDDKVVEPVCDPTTVPDIDVKSAIAFNNKRQFRLDWVRNLQQTLVGKMTIKDGNFDEELVKAIAKFQHCHPKLSKGVDGKIGKNSRTELEASHPVLQTTIIGDNLDSRILVPGTADDTQKYNYYKGIIESTGGVFLSGGGEMNLLGMRGVKIADGSEAHQVDGQTLAAGTLYQTESAKDFAEARKAGKTDDHMKFSKSEGHDDMIISLWVEKDGTIKVKERQGSVDPASAWKEDKYGTGHLRDGQNAFKLGSHSTGSASHKKAANGIDDPNKVINVRSAGKGRIRYDALTPARKQEVWRNSDSNNLHISEAEEAQSNKQVNANHGRYFADNFAINIHTSGNTYGNSVACQNVPADQFVDFMSENKAATNGNNILYTLIDASKIADGLKLVKSEKVEE